MSLLSFFGSKPKDKYHAEAQTLLNKHPEVCGLLANVLPRLNFRESKHDLWFSQEFVNYWPTRGHKGVKRSQEELLRLVKQPCFDLEISRFILQFNAEMFGENATEALRSFLKHGTEEEYVKAKLNGMVVTLAEGIDVNFEKEVHAKNGILTSAKDIRGLVTYGKKPCSLTMDQDDYNKLPKDGQKRVDDLLKTREYSHLTIGLHDVALGGKRRKTKKRKSKKRKTKRRA